MLAPIPHHARAPLALLFEGFPGLRGVLLAVLEGTMGEAWADDPAHPNVARLKLDFEAIAGDPSHPAAPEAIRSLTQGDHLVVPESWADVLMDTWEPLQPYERTEFSPGTWDIAGLRARQALPEGLTLVRIDASNVAAFADLDDAFVYNFDSHEDYLARGVGFGIYLSVHPEPVEGRGQSSAQAEPVEAEAHPLNHITQTNNPTHADHPNQQPHIEFIAGCSSYAIGSRSLEFEIETAEVHQRRGLAMVTGSRMIQHCLETGLEPCWDAAHEGSARLALKLGFTDPQPYRAYRLE